MSQLRQLLRRPLARVAALALLLIVLLASAGGLIAPRLSLGARATKSDCQLQSAQGDIQHVIYLQFDNVHFTRDNPNVPSDLEQMPHLLNFIEGNGALLANHHTPLIAHTGTDIVTSLTGLYGDQHGLAVSNSYRYYTANGASASTGAFAYWTDKIPDGTYNLTGPDGKNAPAPWVPYTRAGCAFGAVAAANTVLENTGTDITTVFGANSAEAAEVKATPSQAYADYVGIAVHCPQGDALCSGAHGGKTDALPDEPGGYTGYSALYGHKYVAPQISPNGPLTDLNGNVIQDEYRGKSYIGFPGFDGMNAATSLAYVAAMQEHGVPITYAYISDAHDNHSDDAGAYGPGQSGYVAALKAYDSAFATFFDRLAHDGITQRNTLFVVTSDENDHFVGGAPSPATCDGVTTPCSYSQIGEINVNATGLLATQQHVTTPFAVHADSAPVFYLNGQPARENVTARDFERATSQLTADNPLTGKTEPITNYLADPVEMRLLHMITGDAARTPTFTMFAKPDYYLNTGSANCNQPCVSENPAYAWNHGDVSPDINVTWLGMVGPGVRHAGVDRSIWSDHTDIRPTMLALLGLKDDYVSQGRALFEALDEWALPKAVRPHRDDLIRLAQAYKQLNAPVGALGMASLKVSTTALASGTASDDSAYARLEGQLTTLTTQRDALARQIAALLNSVTFGDAHNGYGASAQSETSDAQSLAAQANQLIGQAQQDAEQK